MGKLLQVTLNNKTEKIINKIKKGEKAFFVNKAIEFFVKTKECQAFFDISLEEEKNIKKSTSTLTSTSQSHQSQSLQGW
jgi:hypothetical protein